MKIIQASIDLSKIDKSKLVKTDKNGQPFKNGAIYLNVSIFLNSEPDQYGNHCSIALNQSKEEKGQKKTYIGNGKVVFSNSDKPAEAPQQESTQTNLNDLPF